MAQQTITARSILWIAACGIVAVVAAHVLRGPITSADRGFTSMKYALRGQSRPDTNIVLVYVDDAATASIGWPVRRNFYALLINALADLKVRAVGVEVLFEDTKTEYPEYDELLAGVTGSGRNVVLSSYFAAVGWNERQEHSDTTVADLFSYDRVRGIPQHGSGLHLPFTPLRQAAAGIGHLNIEEGGDIPVFITCGESSVPAFAAEVLRVYLGAGRMGVAFDGSTFTVERGNRFVMFTVNGQGAATLLFPGSFSAFRAYPLLEVLRSYDAVRAERTGTVPVLSFRDKIVLVGVVAEGRSRFVDTPVASNYPSLGLHATFLDNALRSRFLLTPSPTTVTILVLLAAISAAASVVFLRQPWNLFVGLGIPLLLVLSSFVLFAAAGIDLPLVSPAGMALFVSGASLVFRHRQMSRAMGALEEEKRVIQKQLLDREAKVSALEQELAGRAESAERTSALLEEMRRYKAEIRDLTSRAEDMEVAEETGVGDAAAEFGGIIYDPRGRMKGIVDFIRKIAGSNAPVLVLGESGTGKELVARAIHTQSTRAAKPFLAVNCGALAETLLESELFGHEKGAFTGAVKERQGRFELADGGTIFLDEIGEISEGFQLKLLRVLQEGEFERVGGSRTIRVDVRVVAATNRELKEETRRKKFREDLYYRLNVLTVALPPLRERKGDLPLLIRHFVQREGSDLRLSKNVMDALTAYSWPGNIRELESTVRRAVLLARAERRSLVSIKDLGEDIAAAARPGVPVEEQVLDLVRERKFLRSAVSDTAGDLGGLSRGTVAEYLRGECLRIFVESGLDLASAVRRISLSAEDAVNDRVEKRLREYLENIAEAVDRKQSWEANQIGLRPKAKNLPQRYHQYLDRIGEGLYRGEWSLPRKQH